MTTVVFSMIIIVALGLAVTAVVGIGMRGKLAGNVSESAVDRLHLVASHLNGDAPMPTAMHNAARKLVRR